MSITSLRPSLTAVFHEQGRCDNTMNHRQNNRPPVPLNRQDGRNFLLSALALLAVMLMCFLFGAAAGEGDVLSMGDKGQDVKEVKIRLQELRYLGNGSVTKTFNEKTESAVREFQRRNGLPETGTVDGATRERLFSEDAVSMPHPTLKPLATPAPTPAPDWPERDPEGFLAGEGEYVYENDGEGLWIYLSRTLQVIITAREDSSVPLEWFETEIRVKDGERFYTVQTDPEHPGKKFRYPYDIARDAGCVLAFSDDFFATRMSKKETVGIILRDGQILSEETNRTSGHHLPNLDMMAFYPDGTLEVYECNELTAGELQRRGATDVFSFGPILLRDGEINEKLYHYFRSVEPRQALGMIEPGHFLLISVQGRNRDSKGTMLQRVAEMMKERGVRQALNLDGGNTMALVFRGRMLNKLAVYKRKGFVRTVTSVIGIGRTQGSAD